MSDGLQTRVTRLPDAGQQGQQFSNNIIKKFSTQVAPTPTNGLVTGFAVFSTSSSAGLRSGSNTKAAGQAFIGIAGADKIAPVLEILSGFTSSYPVGTIADVLADGECWVTLTSSSTLDAFGEYVFADNVTGALQSNASNTPIVGKTLTNFRVVSSAANQSSGAANIYYISSIQPIVF